jgi:DNA-binding protein HU-beta
LLYNKGVVIIRVNCRSDLGLEGSRSKYYKLYLKFYMNKQALAEWVHGKLGGTKVQAEEVVDGLFGAIIDTLKKGGEVSIAGFGIFSVKARAARMARNPKTGEQVKVAAKKVPKFRPAKGLKDTLA